MSNTLFQEKEGLTWQMFYFLQSTGEQNSTIPFSESLGHSTLNQSSFMLQKQLENKDSGRQW